MGARRTPNGRLRERLEEAQWSGAELARAVNAAGRQAGVRASYDRSNVSHWLAGTRPRPSARDLLVRAFAERLGRLVTVEELGFGAVGATRSEATADAGGPFGYGGYAGSALRYGTRPARQQVYGAARSVPRYTMPVQPGPRDAADAAGAGAGRRVAVRRVTVGTGGGGGARRELADLVLEHRDPRQLRRLRELPYRSPHLTPPGGYAAARDAADREPNEWEAPDAWDTDDGRDGPESASASKDEGRAGVVVTAALGLLERSGGRAVRELIVGELSGTDRAEAARLCRMLGRAWADDLGHGAAQRALELSAALAAEARRPVLRAAALRDMSVLALELGRTNEALALAEAAVDQGFDGAGAGTRAFLLTQRGVTRAVAGDSGGAVKDMDGAEYWIDRGDDDENGPYSFGALLYQVARMHRAEGDLRRSVSALELSLSMRPPAEQRSRALIRIELAHQRLGTADYAAAADELRMLAPGHEPLRSARVDAALAYLRNRALSPDPAPLPRIAYRGRC
ncbi:helix-turn-helix domain-containing protein [Streptomyces boluensis]|uniref:Uncharacterized protein n=1 Tax=Streptomyces boluensis TaxID=1775135 RepID=A0A964UVC5_9ACTN|nr:helix-turn-helix transcriptional regulator [Streptomyces boluensis]NBE55407.1 hypothetical protein [Streptomyces boluensis]